MVLKEYWPRCLQELIEFQQIANAEQPEFEKVVSDVKSAADDFFLVSLSEYGCERWEKILGLSVEPGDTLQDRRDRILIKYLDQLPYTYRTLLKYLATVSEDFTVTLNENAYDLYIRIRLEGYAQRDALAATLGQMIPANLVLRLRTDIPQDDQPTKTAACSAMATMNRHKYTPATEGGKANGKIQVHCHGRRKRSPNSPYRVRTEIDTDTRGRRKRRRPGQP